MKLLSALAVLCTAFPVHAFRTALATGVRRRAAFADLGLPTAVVAIAALVWWVSPAVGVLEPPIAWWWLAVAVGAGPVAIATEIGAGATVAKLRGRTVARIRVHDRAPGRSLRALLVVTVVAVAEEVIFRGIGQYQLMTVFGWPAVAAIALISVVYALNHLYFGWLTVGQKAITGLQYGVLYVLSGHSVIIPIVAHVVQNLLVLTVLPRLEARR